MHFTTLFSASAFLQLSRAGYVLKDDYMTDFYGGFNFFTAKDPTDGMCQFSTAMDILLTMIQVS